jgi:hypothetical protein
LSDASYARLLSAIDQSFSPDRMRAAVAKEITSGLTAAEETQVLAWLSADLGARFTRIEEKTGEPAEAARIEKGAEQFYRRVGPERRKLCERMSAALEAGETNATLFINVTTAVLYGIAISEPSGDEAIVATVRKKLEAQRPEMVAEMSKHATWSFAFTYQDVGDDDLEAYVNFLETPAARHFNKLSFKGITEGFQHGALDLGRALGKEAGKDAAKSERRS